MTISHWEDLSGENYYVDTVGGISKAKCGLDDEPKTTRTRSSKGNYVCFREVGIDLEFHYYVIPST